MLAVVLLGILASVLFGGPVLLAVIRYGRPLGPPPKMVDPHDTAGDYKRDILSVIKGAATDVMMARGEVPFGVYDREVAAALQQAHIERGVKITLVCGPLIEVPDGGEPHPILALADEGVLDLYYRNKEDRPAYHFTVADAKTLYWEAPHPPRAREREVWYQNNSWFNAPNWRWRLLGDIESGEVIRVQSYKEHFVLKTRHEIEVLRHLASRQSMNLDDLSGDQMRALDASTRSAGGDDAGNC